VPNKITGETTLAQVLKYPGAEEILSRYSLPCLHCPAAAYEVGLLKIEEVAKAYGIDVDGLLRDLNKVIK